MHEKTACYVDSESEDSRSPSQRVMHHVMARVLTQVSSRRGGPLSQTPTYTTTLPLGPFFSDTDLFFRARNSTVVSSSNINTVHSANRTLLCFPKSLISSFYPSTHLSRSLSLRVTDWGAYSHQPLTKFLMFHPAACLDSQATS